MSLTAKFENTLTGSGPRNDQDTPPAGTKRVNTLWERREESATIENTQPMQLCEAVSCCVQLQSFFIPLQFHLVSVFSV